MENILIIGCGKFGTAIASSISTKYNVIIWSRNINTVNSINNTQINYKYFPNLKLKYNISSSISLYQSIKKSKIIINALPSNASIILFKLIKQYLKEHHIFINLSKGINYYNGNSHTLYESFIQSIPFLKNKYFSLLGPSFADDIINNKLVILEVSSINKNMDKYKDELNIFNDNIILKFSSNIIINEFFSSLKNVIAISVGVFEGLKLSGSTQAAIASLGYKEILSIFKYRYPSIELNYNYLGIASLGDFILTVTSNLSRNRMYGINIVNTIQNSSLKEGINSCTTCIHIINNNCHINDIVIINNLYKLLNTKISVNQFYNIIINKLKNS